MLIITGADAKGRRCLILWCSLERIDHFTLDAWFECNRASFPEQFAVVYTNGDHTLNAMRKPGGTWIAETLESILREWMFEERHGDTG